MRRGSRRNRCSDAARSHGDGGRRPAHRSRHARLDQRGGAAAARATASAGRCGSPPSARPRGGAGAGRTWVSEPGNLYASLLLTDPAPPERCPELSFVAALALHDAVGGRIPGLSNRLALKWPNDLLIDRNKFAGILIEGERDERGDRDRRQLRASSGRHRLSGDRSRHGRRPHLARKPVRAAVGRDGGPPRAMEPRRGLCRDPRRLARARRGRRQAHPRQVGRWRACRPVRNPRRNRPLGAPPCQMGQCRP